MLQRYRAIRSSIPFVEAVKEMVLSTCDHKKSAAPLKHLLESKATTVGEVCLLIDPVIADYPIMGGPL
ncbi:hypothetical protein GN244_ATG07463 [Phytophthora infestans]|uniref:Uncharacterized protein n=1 Tax=Phytophthora infestans TaxID=4787 RepID=A0A833S4G5_PHYIN|nr:hypothetical protein GN244_ATG07463 [Phytophthora infestans]